MWQVLFFTNPLGKSPVKEFILQLEPVGKAKVNSILDLLKEYGPQLREPHSKKLSGYSGLFELRTSGSPAIRLIYTSYQRSFLILHIFVKKTNKTPSKEINIALNRRP